MRNLRIKITSECGYVEFVTLAVYLGLEVWDTFHFNFSTCAAEASTGSPFQHKNYGLGREVGVEDEGLGALIVRHSLMNNDLGV